MTSLTTVFRFTCLLEFFFLVNHAKAQSSFVNAQVKTNPATYTVSATMDTAYERYIEIALNDTLIDSLHVKLTLFSSGSQVIVKDTAYKANSVLRSANVADLGAYKINSLIWRIPLGDISLLTRHGIHLDIVGLKPGDSFTFDDEF